MKKLLVVALILAPLAANAGVLKCSYKVSKTSTKYAYRASKAGVKGAVKAVKVAKKVLY